LHIAKCNVSGLPKEAKSNLSVYFGIEGKKIIFTPQSQQVFFSPPLSENETPHGLRQIGPAGYSWNQTLNRHEEIEAPMTPG
jgi:hypothetical protein